MVITPTLLIVSGIFLVLGVIYAIYSGLKYSPSYNEKGAGLEINRGSPFPKGLAHQDDTLGIVMAIIPRADVNG